MLLTLNTAQGLELIESPKIIREDQIIPGHFRPCPESTYETGFDWLFRYECNIAHFLAPLVRPYLEDVVGPDGLLHEVLLNAFRHGHNKDMLKPIVVRVLLGKAGLIICIDDSGNGFNVQKIYRDFVSNRRFFSSVGAGIRLMDASPRFGVFYNRKGTQAHLLYLFEYELRELGPEFILTSGLSKPEPNVTKLGDMKSTPA